MKKFFIWIVAMCFFMPSYLYGQNPKPSAKEIYELNEKCGKRSAELFEKHYGKNGTSNDNDASWLSNYTCHYNRKLNKCFMLITSKSYPKNKKEQDNNGSFTDKTLWDINENKQYGQFNRFAKIKNSMQCEVLEKNCNSEYEWDSLVKPYMEE